MDNEDNCYKCIHKRNIPGDGHIQCKKPDPEMTGNPHGVKMSWFLYPFNFDPIWRTKKCANFDAGKELTS